MKRLQLNSLSLKILMAYIFGTVLSIIIVVVTTYWLFTINKNYLIRTDITALTQDQATKLRFNYAGEPIGFYPNHNLHWAFESLTQETAYRVLNEAGDMVLSSAIDSNFWKESDVSTQKSKSFNFYHNSSLIYGATTHIEHQGQNWYVQFAVSARFYDLVYQKIALPFMSRGIIWFSLVLLFIFGVCTYFTLKYTLKPLHSTSKAAMAIAPDSLHTRLSTQKVPSEIIPLVNSFNQVLDRLEQGFRIQQEFLATAAHELKTPLALIRAQIEMKDKDEDRDMLLNDVEHMTRQVQQLLLLAEVSEVQNYILKDVNLIYVAKEVIDYLQPMAALANIELLINQIPEPEYMLQADRSALFILLKNLIENAIQHAPPNTIVDINIKQSSISIRDWGIGIDEAQKSLMFVRFWRGTHRRDHGAGLGLSICQEIAQAHGWDLSAQKLEQGLRMIIRFSANHNKTQKRQT